MSAKTTTDRKAGSAARGPRALERLLIVAAVAAVLVSVGAWIAMNRPDGGAEAAGAASSVTTTGGTSTEAPATATDAGTGDQAAVTAPQSASAPAVDAAAGQDSTSATGRPNTPAAPTAAATPALSPTTAFLSALAASGLAPPVDDAQKLAMADDVCQEMGYGATYDDVVRALTFAGATDAEAANFAQLSIANLCPQHKAG